ncbi:heme exporter protein CcmD [Porphyrobacter sp. GA68]|uniref:heme exporter protein CcmD n=1 Tax=Porphyrobacter sp. GA68 TaxID=2883480 RepID=UPI001D18DD74|nr:heme exporter protein CcmD [Porphyrobacter sp. GA68]
MREALDQWDFVIAAYAVTVAGLALLLVWSWLSMRSAERRRDAARDKEARR